jgi:hypothetical protein
MTLKPKKNKSKTVKHSQKKSPKTLDVHKVKSGLTKSIDEGFNIMGDEGYDIDIDVYTNPADKTQATIGITLKPRSSSVRYEMEEVPKRDFAFEMKVYVKGMFRKTKYLGGEKDYDKVYLEYEVSDYKK